MTNSALELQTALYDALSAHAGLAAAMGGVRIYDDVPRAPVYPYVSLGSIESRDWSTQTSEGEEHIVTLHVWSRQGGRREAQTALTQIDDCLDDAPLPLASFDLVNLRVVFWTVLREPDGETYHGLIRLRAVTEAPV